MLTEGEGAFDGHNHLQVKGSLIRDG